MFVIVSVGLIYFFVNPKKRYTDPIGGWEEYKSKLEVRYGRNEDMKNAAIQLGASFQESIDYPEKALETFAHVDTGDACFLAVLQKNGFTFDQAVKESNFIEDLMANTWERQRRYIRYNANLSGGVYALVRFDLKHCAFQLKDSK